MPRPRVSPRKRGGGRSKQRGLAGFPPWAASGRRQLPATPSSSRHTRSLSLHPYKPAATAFHCVSTSKNCPDPAGTSENRGTALRGSRERSGPSRGHGRHAGTPSVTEPTRGPADGWKSHRQRARATNVRMTLPEPAASGIEHGGPGAAEAGWGLRGGRAEQRASGGRGVVAAGGHRGPPTPAAALGPETAARAKVTQRPRPGPSRFPRGAPAVRARYLREAPAPGPASRTQFP